MPVKKIIKKSTAINKSASENTSSNSIRTKYFTKKNLIIVVLIIIISAVLYLSKNQLIVATVNGEPINRFTFINELEKQDGKRILESLVSKTLVLQEAKKKNINITPSEIDSEIKNIEDNLKTRGQTLDQVLKLQGITMDTVKDQIKLNLLMKKLLGANVSVTDKEVSDYMEKNKSLIPEGTNPDESKKQIKTQLEQQKFQEKAQEFMKNLQDKAKIKYFLKI